MAANVLYPLVQVCGELWNKLKYVDEYDMKSRCLAATPPVEYHSDLSVEGENVAPSSFLTSFGATCIPSLEHCYPTRTMPILMECSVGEEMTVLPSDSSAGTTTFMEHQMECFDGREIEVTSSGAIWCHEEKSETSADTPVDYPIECSQSGDETLATSTSLVVSAEATPPVDYPIVCSGDETLATSRATLPVEYSARSNHTSLVSFIAHVPGAGKPVAGHVMCDEEFMGSSPALKLKANQLCGADEMQFTLNINSADCSLPPATASNQDGVAGWTGRTSGHQKVT